MFLCGLSYIIKRICRWKNNHQNNVSDNSKAVISETREPGLDMYQVYPVYPPPVQRMSSAPAQLINSRLQSQDYNFNLLRSNPLCQYYPKLKNSLKQLETLHIPVKSKLTRVETEV